jgi:hypothetical protein
VIIILIIHLSCCKMNIPWMHMFDEVHAHCRQNSSPGSHWLAYVVRSAKMRGPLWPCINLSWKFGMKNREEEEVRCIRGKATAAVLIEMQIRVSWSVMMTLPCSCMKFCRQAPAGRTIVPAIIAYSKCSERRSCCSRAPTAAKVAIKCHPHVRLIARGTNSR